VPDRRPPPTAALRCLALLSAQLAACGDSVAQTDSASASDSAATTEPGTGAPPTPTGDPSTSSATDLATSATTGPADTTDGVLPTTTGVTSTTPGTTDPTTTTGTGDTGDDTTGDTGSDTGDTGTTGDTGDPPPAGELDFDAIKSDSVGAFSAGSGSRLYDLDGDGRTDAVVPLPTENLINVLLAGADGHYAVTASYPLPNIGPIALGDLDGDAEPDILATAVNGTFVLRGNGDGTFGAAEKLPADASPAGGTLADVDGDGDLDAVHMYMSSSILTFLGDGAGAFTPPVKTALQFNSNLALGDFDGDGRTDVITRYDTPQIKPYYRVGLANADGTFTMLAPVAMLAKDGIALGKTFNFTIADLDADGRDDIGLSDTLGISIYRALPAGTFEHLARYSVSDYGAGAAFGHLDDDAVLDLVTASFDDSLVYVRSGLGGGLFSDPPVTYDGGGRCTGPRTADVDGDETTDLVFACGGLGVALGRDDATFTAAPALIADVRPNDSVIADFDEDGHPDVAVGYQDGKSFAVFPGHGDGTFAAPLPSVAAKDGVRHLVAADLDEDGHMDLLTAVHGLGQAKSLNVHLGAGDGTFAPPDVYPGAWRIAVADLDDDGHLDVVTAGYDLLLPLIGDGTGALAPGMPIPAGQGLFNISVADLDGDDDLDVAASSYQTGEVVLAWGQGDGSFAAKTTAVTTGNNPWFVHAADFTGDGITDLLHAVAAPNQIPGLTVVPGVGDGSFAAPIPFLASHFDVTSAMVVDDFDGDGRPDVFYAPSNGNVVARVGLPGGSFGPQLVYNFSSPGSFASGDLDHDGRPDVLISSRSPFKRSHIAVFLNASK